MGGYTHQSGEMVDELHMVFQLICPVNFLVIFAAVEKASLLCGNEISLMLPCFLLCLSSYMLFVVCVELSKKYTPSAGMWV